jgi:anhydro-N-acetylmuramic acid kinase
MPALPETDGITLSRTGPSIYRPYSGPERVLLRQALADAVRSATEDRAPGVLSEAEQLVTEAHAETVERLFQEQRFDRIQIAITGFHGQTVLHRPASGLTVQIGDGPGSVPRLGSRWRTISGLPTWQQEGRASLVPIYHQRLPQHSIGRFSHNHRPNLRVLTYRP